MKNDRHNLPFSIPVMMSSNCLFCLTTSPKPEILNLQKHKTRESSKFEKLKVVVVLHFCFIKESVINIVKGLVQCCWEETYLFC